MFLPQATTPEAVEFLEKGRAANGYVSNDERVWSWRPDVAEGFTALRKQLLATIGLSPREIAVVVCATVRTLGDSYCSLAWGGRLAELSDAALAADVLRGTDPAALTARETALKHWCEQVARDPNGSSAANIAELRAAGLSDREIFEATALAAFRLAFSTVNDALGARPDRELADDVPPEVRAAVTYGRPPAD